MVKYFKMKSELKFRTIIPPKLLINVNHSFVCHRFTNTITTKIQTLSPYLDIEWKTLDEETFFQFQFKKIT